MVRLFSHAGQALTEAGKPLGNDNTVLQEEPADLIHHRCPVLHKPLPHAMERLEILLLDSFNRYGRDIGSLARFRQRQRIIGIIFLPPPEWGHVLRSQYAYLMAQRAKASRPVMRPTTRFHEDEGGRL